MNDPIIRFIVEDGRFRFGPFASSLEAFIWAEERRKRMHDCDDGTGLFSYTIAELREAR